MRRLKLVGDKGGHFLVVACVKCPHINNDRREAAIRNVSGSCLFAADEVRPFLFIKCHTIVGLKLFTLSVGEGVGGKALKSVYFCSTRLSSSGYTPLHS